jgi:hypothetical protein
LIALQVIFLSAQMVLRREVSVRGDSSAAQLSKYRQEVLGGTLPGVTVCCMPPDD